MARLSDIGESGMLTALLPLLRRQTEGLLLGTGDDVAVTAPVSSRAAWTVDSMVEGTHFRWWKNVAVTPEALARKLVVSNVSDLASKGARPLYGLLSIGVPGDTEMEQLMRFYAGLEESLNEYGAKLIGGDTVRAPQWVLTLALVGTVRDGAAIAGRHRARAGQNVYVTGTPGESHAGYLVLDKELKLEEPHRSRVVERHVWPSVNPALGEELTMRFADIAMLDLSDGLGIDATRVAKLSGVCVVIEEALLPVSEALAAAARAAGQSAAQMMLHGGEDYELLFCTTAGESEMPHDAQITRIGYVEEGQAEVLVQRPDGTREPTPAGFEHF